MASNRDSLGTGALVVGGGLAGYALWRWLAPGRAEAATAKGAVTVAADAVASLPGTPKDPYPDPPATPPAPSPEESAVGPVTSPSQVDSPPASGGLSREFDKHFEKYRGSIPIEYLRALAKRESGMRPGERSGPAWGLMQIVEVVRKDFNEAHGTHYARKDLLDPAVSVAMCCWVLRFIVESYGRNHPNVPNLRADWDNPRFVELLTFGWNAGFSEKAGVGKVVGYLEGLGAKDVDLDQVHGHARLAGASRHLSNEKKVRWCKSVVELYQRERSPRNAARRRRARRRGAKATQHTIFVFRTYPQGMWGPVVTRWYRADPPTTWDEAKRRLIAAGLLDVRILRPSEWKLAADPPFRIQEDRVRPLPGGER